MSARIGINGFGRIGRDYLRYALEAQDTDLEVVAVTDVTVSATMARLLRCDSTFGPLHRDVEDLGEAIAVDGNKIAVSAERDPAQLACRDHGVDIVIESTGKFRTRETASAHVRAGASKLLLSSPGKGVDATIVMDVNHDTYDPSRHHIISNASCTTNCVAPMVKFAAPTKFIGPLSDEARGRELAGRRGWPVARDGSHRCRVVASPEPTGIVELKAVTVLLHAGVTVVCGGGGGPPVVMDAAGVLSGRSVVVDKDLTGALLALATDADHLLLLTDVPAVLPDFGTDHAVALLSLDELAGMSLPAGSTGPKAGPVDDPSAPAAARRRSGR